MKNNDLLEKISYSVETLVEEEIVPLCKRALDKGIPAETIIQDGLIKGMSKVSVLFDEDIYYLPEVFMASEIMNMGIDFLRSYVTKTNKNSRIKIVIGVIEGDTHDIGKNLVRIMQEADGMTVYDLGRDVPLENFIEKAEEVQADIIAMSTLMTTTMGGMKTVIQKLNERGIRDKYKVMVGGAPISLSYAKSIGADFYSKDASEAVKIVNKILKR